MGEAITVTLSDELKRAIDDIALKDGVSLSALIDEALKEYLFVRRFRLLRERMIPKAQKQDIYTDQDVFDCVS